MAKSDAVNLPIGARATLICVRHDYAQTLAFVHDLLVLSQLSLAEYEHKSSHIKNRLKMIDMALGEIDDATDS